jgi:hypothetical protein
MSSEIDEILDEYIVALIILLLSIYKEFSKNNDTW